MTNGNDYTPEEFAKLVHRHYNTVYRWIQSGAVSAFKIGGRWFIPSNALEIMKAKGTNQEDLEDEQGKAHK